MNLMRPQNFETTYRSVLCYQWRTKLKSSKTPANGRTGLLSLNIHIHHIYNYNNVQLTICDFAICIFTTILKLLYSPSLQCPSVPRGLIKVSSYAHLFKWGFKILAHDISVPLISQSCEFLGILVTKLSWSAVVALSWLKCTKLCENHTPHLY